MKILHFIIFSTAVNLCCGGTLRVSKVADKASENTEQMKYEAGAQVIFVEKASLLSDADVKRAVPNYGLDNAFYVELTDDGARKLKEATERMLYGQDRLAIIIEGSIASAPVVQAPLGRDFVLSNLVHRQRSNGHIMRRQSSARFWLV